MIYIYIYIYVYTMDGELKAHYLRKNYHFQISAMFKIIHLVMVTNVPTKIINELSKMQK